MLHMYAEILSPDCILTNLRSKDFLLCSVYDSLPDTFRIYFTIHFNQVKRPADISSFNHGKPRIWKVFHFQKFRKKHGDVTTLALLFLLSLCERQKYKIFTIEHVFKSKIA